MEQAEIKEIFNNLKIISQKSEIKEISEKEEGKYHFKQRLLGNIQTFLKRSGVPKRFLKPKSLSDNFNLQSGYYFYGKVGTGKTDFSVSIIKNIILNTEPVYEYGNFRLPENLCLFVSVPSMILDIRSAFKSATADESELLRKYIKPDVLVLDDLGTEKVSEWVIQTLYLLINSRYEEEKQTIITSNFSLVEIANGLGAKIASRISGMTKVIEVSGIDRRSVIAVVK